MLPSEDTVVFVDSNRHTVFMVQGNRSSKLQDLVVNFGQSCVDVFWRQNKFTTLAGGFVQCCFSC